MIVARIPPMGNGRPQKKELTVHHWARDKKGREYLVCTDPKTKMFWTILPQWIVTPRRARRRRANAATG